MEIIKEKLSNGNEITYKIVNGTAYHIETPDNLVITLESLRVQRIRIKLYYGDPKTGKCWNDEHYTMGYISRSTGTIKIPLLIANSRSHGGGGLLDHCIIKIRESKGKHVRYQLPNFQQSKFEIVPSDLPEYTHNVNINDTLYSRHKSERSAQLLINKLS